MAPQSLEELQRENNTFRQRLEEAESTIRAMSSGEVDAFLVRRGADDQVLVLDGVDRPYRLLTERMQQGAATVTADGTLVYVNRRCAELVAMPAAQLLGTNLGAFIEPAERPAFAVLLGRGLAGEAEREFVLRRGDGSSCPALITAGPLREPPDVLCLVVTDLTQQKRQELEREHLVQEQAAWATAEQAAAILRDADRRKDEFLAMLAHELRNPLASIRNGTQILNLVGSREPLAQKTREMMGRQLEGLVRLVDDLLDVGRVTQGKIELQRERTDLQAVVARVLESCRAFIDERGHRLQAALPAGPVPVDVDVVRCIQVLTNLLNNAAKFTPRGGTIRLGVEPDWPARTIAIRIQDNGVGIAPEMLGRVFDLFAQADPTISRSEGGLGIGLTLARRLVEMHGGSLEAASGGLGQGSEFTVRLPLAGEPDAAHPPPAPLCTFVARRILVVDDNHDAAESLATLLRLLGHDVRLAFDGERALAVLAEFIPDILLLDIGMPGMDGYEVARQVRAHDRFRQVRVVALSGYGSEQDFHRSAAAGFDDHLVKPVDRAALEEVLAAAQPAPAVRSHQPHG